MQKALTWITVALVCASCLIYLVTTVIALNCVTQKKNDCARASGTTALVFGCLLASGIAAVYWGSKGRSQQI